MLHRHRRGTMCTDVKVRLTGCLSSNYSLVQLVPARPPRPRRRPGIVFAPVHAKCSFPVLQRNATPAGCTGDYGGTDILARPIIRRSGRPACFSPIRYDRLNRLAARYHRNFPIGSANSRSSALTAPPVSQGSQTFLHPLFRLASVTKYPYTLHFDARAVIRGIYSVSESL